MAVAPPLPSHSAPPFHFRLRLRLCLARRAVVAGSSRSGSETTARPRAPVGIQASSSICRRYDERCKKLRYQESRGENQIDIDFTRTSAKDLHCRVLVAVHKIGFISKNIKDVRDKCLQTQLGELVGCFTRTWGTMLQCQCAMIKLASRSCDLKISFQSESQCQAGFLLLVELRKLCSNFQNWMASQKAYHCSLNMWLHKCMQSMKRMKVSRNQNAVDTSLTETADKLLDDIPSADLE